MSEWRFGIDGGWVMTRGRFNLRESGGQKKKEIQSDWKPALEIKSGKKKKRMVGCTKSHTVSVKH